MYKGVGDFRIKATTWESVRGCFGYKARFVELSRRANVYWNSFPRTAPRGETGVAGTRQTSESNCTSFLSGVFY